MPVYSYRALDKQGKNVRGVIDSETPRMARQRLRADGLHPVEVGLASGSRARGARSPIKLGRRFSIRRNRTSLLADTTRQAATLLAAGLPLVTALTTIWEQTEDQEYGQILALVKEEVTGGESLANSLARHQDYFPSDYVHLIRAGEMGGALDQVLSRLADALEKRQARKAKVTGALAYPIFMTLVGAGVLFFLLSFIIPTLTGLFDNLGAALPWPTRLLLWVSSFLKSYWWAVLAALGGAGFLFSRHLKKEKNYRRLEVRVFGLPLIGALFQKLLLAQSLRGLAVMAGGGVPLTTALDVTSLSLGRSSFSKALATASEMVGQGRSLADGLAASGLFPPLAKRMVAVGEASGTLTDMLSRVAQTYEDETDRVLATLTSLVEPVIILVMGLLVGFVVMAVLLPIFDLSGLVG
ncbi:MAG: type II secretion system F family protein [Pseudomonadota bacterium]